MPSLAAYPAMMQRDRKREGLRVCRAAWLVGVTVWEYREMEAGDRVPDAARWKRMVEVFQWPLALAPPYSEGRSQWHAVLPESVNVLPASGTNCQS